MPTFRQLGARAHRVGFLLSARVVGAIRRRPLRYLVLWFLATWLPPALADVVQLFFPLLVLLAFVFAGGSRHRETVETVSRYWSRVNGKKHRSGWFGLRGFRARVGANSSRGGL